MCPSLCAHCLHLMPLSAGAVAGATTAALASFASAFGLIVYMCLLFAADVDACRGGRGGYNRGSGGRSSRRSRSRSRSCSRGPTERDRDRDGRGGTGGSSSRYASGGRRDRDRDRERDRDYDRRDYDSR
jgi:hypothetical protein